MRNLVITASILTLPFLTSQPVLAADELQPDGKWAVDFGEDHCVAHRAYGSQDGPLRLVLRPSPIGDVMQLEIVDKATNWRAYQEKATLTLTNGEPLRLLQLRYGTQGFQVRQVNLVREQSGRLAQSTSLGWSAHGQEFRFALGSMASLMTTVEDCRLSLAEYWNGTPAKQALLQKPPSLMRPLDKVLSTEDYPWAAFLSRQSGAAGVVALIDENGMMANCSVIEPSGIAVLDAQTCIILSKRAKFTPAIGADGKPTKGIFTQRIRWEIPD